MATKSIFKNIRIKNKGLSQGFISALENAHKKQSKEVRLQRSCSDIRGEDIKKFFGDKQE